MTDIVERLRQNNHLANSREVMGEAADEIMALQAEVDQTETAWLNYKTEAQAEIARLREALKECADDLEFEIEHTYEGTLQYPSMRRKRERDMAPVDKARKLLGEQK